MVYQDLDDLIAAVQKGNLDIKEFDCSCFNGQYVTNNISDDYLDKIKAIRNDSAKNDTEEPLVAGMDLHNNA